MFPEETAPSACPSFLPNSGNTNLGPIRNAGQLREIRKTVSSPYLSKLNEDSGNDSHVVPKLRKSRSVSVVGVSIPDFGRERGAWRKAIMQWEQGTPDMPQSLALKDWPEVWYTKGMALVTGTKRSQHKLIADEYNRCVPNDFHCRSAKYSHSRLLGLDVMMQDSWKLIHLQIPSR